MSEATFKIGSDSLLNERLGRLGLRQLDVRRMGNCLVKAIAHQLYNNTICHFKIRRLGVQYLRDNPDQFIESVTDKLWSQYLSSMSVQGTWGDHIIQAIADAMDLKIHIVESSENFSEITLVEGLNVSQHSRSIYIEHT